MTDLKDIIHFMRKYVHVSPTVINRRVYFPIEVYLHGGEFRYYLKNNNPWGYYNSKELFVTDNYATLVGYHESFRETLRFINLGDYEPVYLVTPEGGGLTFVKRDTLPDYKCSTFSFDHLPKKGRRYCIPVRSGGLSYQLRLTPSLVDFYVQLSTKSGTYYDYGLLIGNGKVEIETARYNNVDDALDRFLKGKEFADEREKKEVEYTTFKAVATTGQLAFIYK